MGAMGAKCWIIPEGYLPSWSNGKEPQMTSHESISVINTGDDDAHLEILLYFASREPVGPYKEVVPAHRTKHIRYNNLREPEKVPEDTDYASVVTSDAPIVVQYTRLDSRQAENALMSVMAYPYEGEVRAGSE